MAKLAVLLLAATAQPALPGTPHAEPHPVVWDTSPMPVPQRVVRGQVSAAPESDAVELGATSEVGLGFGEWRYVFGSQYGYAPSVGFGRFVAPQVALTFRVEGVGIIDDSYALIGVAGPHVQVWFADHAFLGFGGGLAFAAAPGTGDGELAAGVDARVGVAFRPRGRSGANANLEVTTFDDDVLTVALALGYQSF